MSIETKEFIGWLTLFFGSSLLCILSCCAKHLVYHNYLPLSETEPANDLKVKRQILIS